MRKNLPVLALILMLSACASQTGSKVDHQSQRYNPKAARFNTQLGIAYLERGNTERAKRKLLLAQKQDPQSAVVQNAFAYFLEKTGNPERAETYYKKAIELSHGAGAPLNNYGVFLCARGRYDEAQVYFQRAIADPNYVKSADAYENAGLCALNNSKPGKAEHFFKQALAKDPQRPKSLLQLTQLALRVARYQKALGYLKRYETVAGKSKASDRLGLDIAEGLGDRKLMLHYQAKLDSSQSRRVS